MNTSMIKNAFRQVCDKPCANRIIQAQWSPLRDLIAIITSNGDVRLHRLYWQKVWVVPSKESHAVCLSWKNNGKILAVGYENGTLSLYEIEKSSVIHTLNCDAKITSLQWSSQKKEDFAMIYKDSSKNFFPDIDKEELQKRLDKCSLLISDDQHSVLVVGTSSGDIYLFINGVFLLMKLSSDRFPIKYKSSEIVTTSISLVTGQLSVILKGTVENVDQSSQSYFYLYQFESQLFGSRGAELSHLSLKFTKAKNLLNQCEKVLKQMSDASEDIYLKINTKLEKLENLVSANGSSVAAEFTIAYATGVTSPELQTFLTQHLTTKGLKQIAQSVQSGYSSLHNDIKDELELLTQQLMFLFVELQGMAKWFEKFGILGLSLNSLQECLVYLVQFIMKSHELLKVISDDMNNFKIFFNWLARLVFQISGEQNQAISNQLTNEDYDVMLEFLEHRLLKIERSNSSGYDLERVSQFLKDGSLCTQGTDCDSDWYEFVNKHESLKNNPIIVRPDHASTLEELFQRFKKQTTQVFDAVCSTMSDSLTLKLSCNLFKQAEDHDEDCRSLFSFHHVQPSLYLNIIPCSCDFDSFFFLDLSSYNELKVRSLSINSPSKDESFGSTNDPDRYQFTLRDAKFYNQETMTILYEEEDKTDDRTATIFGQVLLKNIVSESFATLTHCVGEGVLDQDAIIPVVNITSLFSEQRRMDAFRGRYLSVNGYSREVSCVISISGRRVRVFDMTAEDDEADESKMDDDSKIDVSNSIVNESAVEVE